MMGTFVLMLILALPPTGADHAWQDGILSDVTRHNFQAQIIEPQIQTGVGDRRIRYSVAFEFTIQTADKFYIAQTQAVEQAGVAPIAASPIDLDTNAHLSFAVEKQTLYLKDKRGKEYKLKIIRQGVGQAEAASSKPPARDLQ